MTYWENSLLQVSKLQSDIMDKINNNKDLTEEQKAIKIALMFNGL